MTTIGIKGTGSLIGQAIIKSIKKSSFKNHRLIGIDYFIDTIGSYWTDENYLLPDILDESISEEVWLKRLVSIIEMKQINILFIGVDFELSILAKHKKYIENKTTCIVVVSNEQTITIADDKYLTYHFLRENGLFFPATFLVSEIDNAILEKEINFPMIIKPRNGYRSIDVYLIKNREDLENKIVKVSNPVIQECIGSEETEYTCGVIAFNNEIKQSIVLRRDLKDGNTSTTYLRHDYPIIIKEYIEDAARKLGQFGVCNFQLRVDKNGIPKIFEINARHSGTTYIRSLYGFNEIEYILEYLVNQKEITFKIKEGTVKRYFEEFLVEDAK